MPKLVDQNAQIEQSKKELVPIINEQDEVIKVVPRKQMRAEHLPHRSSYVVVMDQQQRILVEIRTLAKDYAPGLFDACVGGVMVEHEDFLNSAKREVAEEVGIDVENIAFHALGKHKITFLSGKSFVMAYLFLAKGNCITQRQQSEVSGIMYLTLDELLALKDCTTYDSIIACKEILKRAKEQGIIA